MNVYSGVMHGAAQLDDMPLRKQLAVAFRTAYDRGWNTEVLNHISARTEDGMGFLMNPLGLGWDEITASCFVKSAFDGTRLSHPQAKLAPAGYNFHGGILRARADVGCVLHAHPMPGIVMSALDRPLMILDQGGCALYGEVGTHAFEGFVTEEEEVPRILRDLGDGHALIMENHGLLTIGATVGEAFVWMRRLIDACILNERALATGAPLRRIPIEHVIATRDEMRKRQARNPRHFPEWEYFYRRGVERWPEVEG